MSLPTTDLPERIVAKVVATLEAAYGDGYNYRPREVYRLAQFTEAFLESASGSPWYAVIPDVIHLEEETYRQSRVRVELDVVGALEVTSALSKQGDLFRWQAQHKLLQDVWNAIHADRTLGGVVEFSGLEMADLGAEDTFHDRWILVFVRLFATQTFTDSGGL